MRYSIHQGVDSHSDIEECVAEPLDSLIHRGDCAESNLRREGGREGGRGGRRERGREGGREGEKGGIEGGREGEEGGREKKEGGREEERKLETSPTLPPSFPPSPRH